MMLRHLLYLSLAFYGCDLPTVHSSQVADPASKDVSQSDQKKNIPIPHTPASTGVNTYIGFDAPKAINRIADIENEYFQNYHQSQSQYYGSVWKDYAKEEYASGDSLTVFDRYTATVDQPMMMDCTIYSIQALKAGLGDDFKKMNRYHREIWGSRGYAGWSVGYILTQHFGWKAYLVLSKESKEYDACLRNFKKDKKYHVWKQPDIPLERVYSFEEEQTEIDALLAQHEFGWGFSEQGWHTWITRYDQLKECIWLGAPAPRFEVIGNMPLFRKTKLTDYRDYNSHIIVVPPLAE